MSNVALGALLTKAPAKQPICPPVQMAVALLIKVAASATVPATRVMASVCAAPPPTEISKDSAPAAKVPPVPTVVE
jgi:hypothetical protein